MKKFIIYSCLSLMLLISSPVFAQSGSTCTNQPSTTLCNPVRFYNGDIKSFAFQAVATASSFFTLIGIIYVVFSGFRMIISQGDVEEISAAKSSLTWAILGLILGMFSFVIVNATAFYLKANNPDVNSYTGDKPLFIILQDKTFGDLLKTLLTGFLDVLGILAVLMIVVGGLRYITSAGNEEQAEAGKKTIQWAVLGLITSLLAYVLVQATFTFFRN